VNRSSPVFFCHCSHLSGYLSIKSGPKFQTSPPLHRPLSGPDLTADQSDRAKVRPKVGQPGQPAGEPTSAGGHLSLKAGIRGRRSPPYTVGLFFILSVAARSGEPIRGENHSGSDWPPVSREPLLCFSSPLSRRGERGRQHNEHYLTPGK
jgi:hypothetical protein